jgi:hypothetical protein
VEAAGELDGWETRFGTLLDPDGPSSTRSSDTLATIGDLIGLTTSTVG